MGQKKRYQIAAKQREKRTKSRRKLVAKGQNPDSVYYGQFYIKLG